jgi:hypothetical protein
MAPEPIRLHLMPEALNRDGEPCAALVVPPTPSRYDRRAVTLLFPSVAAALAAKRAMERAEPGGRSMP